MKQDAEELVGQLKDLIDSLIARLSSPDLQDKRGKLRAVRRSIEQLERKDLPIPDDLDRMKKSLSDELGTDNELEETLSMLFRELSGMLTRIENYNSTAGMHPRRSRRHSGRRSHEKKSGGLFRRFF